MHFCGSGVPKTGGLCVVWAYADRRSLHRVGEEYILGVYPSTLKFTTLMKSPLPAGLQTFGDRLQWAIDNRATGGRAALEDRLKVSTQQLSNWLGRETPPSEDTLVKLSDQMEGVPVVWLRYGIDPGDGATTHAPPPPPEPGPEDDPRLIIEWGLLRAKAITGLLDVLREDHRVLEIRAEAALNASRAALLEAQKAPPGQGAEISAELSDRVVRALEALEGVKAVRDAETRTEGRGQRGKRR